MGRKRRPGLITDDDIQNARDAFVDVAAQALKADAKLPPDRTIGVIEASERVKELLFDDAGWRAAERASFAQRLVYENVLEGLSDDVLGLLECVYFIWNNEQGIVSPTASKRWREAIRVVIENGVGAGRLPSNKARVRAFSVAYAGKRMRERGYRVRITGDRVWFDDAEAERLGRDVRMQASQRSTALGLLKVVFENIGPSWDKRLGRFVISRRTAPVPIKHEPSVPWNYVLQFALQRASSRILRPGSGFVLSDLDFIRLLTDIVALYDVEPYSTWEYAFTSMPLFVDRLMRFALFDAVHDLPQRRINDLCPTLDALCGWLRGTSDEALLAVSINHMLAFASVFKSALNAHVRGPQRFNRSIINDALPSEIGETERAALWDLTTHEPGSVNREFTWPSEWAKANSVEKPMIALDADTVLVADAAVASEAFVVAALKRIVQRVPFANDAIGKKGFEEYVRALLDAGGAQVTEGTYSAENRTLEIDALVQTDSAIFVFECKKRMLGLEARSADSDRTIRDVVETMVRAEEQMLRFEAELLERGSVEVSGPSGIQVVSWKAQRIFRVAITLNDWGVFHENSLVQAILRLQGVVRYGHRSSDPVVTAWIDGLNKTTASIARSLERITAVDPTRSRQPSWNFAFLPVSALNAMLAWCGDLATFEKHLQAHCVSSFGHLDVYADLQTRLGIG